MFDDCVEFSRFLYVHLLVKQEEIEAVNKRLAEIEKEKRRQEEIQARSCQKKR